MTVNYGSLKIFYQVLSAVLQKPWRHLLISASRKEPILAVLSLNFRFCPNIFIDKKKIADSIHQTRIVYRIIRAFLILHNVKLLFVFSSKPKAQKNYLVLSSIHEQHSNKWRCIVWAFLTFFISLLRIFSFAATKHKAFDTNHKMFKSEIEKMNWTSLFSTGISIESMLSQQKQLLPILIPSSKTWKTSLHLIGSVLFLLIL